jgi:hypothetical protein
MLNRDAIEGQGSELTVGYRHPPVHSRFKPGVSGNPAGRSKGRKNLRGIFQQILNEKVSLRDGQGVRKISTAEAALRSMVVGALKGRCQKPRHAAPSRRACRGIQGRVLGLVGGQGPALRIAGCNVIRQGPPAGPCH